MHVDTRLLLNDLTVSNVFYGCKFIEGINHFNGITHKKTEKKN